MPFDTTQGLFKKMSVNCARFYLLKWRKMRFILIFYPTMFRNVIEINYEKKIVIGGIDDAPEHVFAVNLEISKTYKTLSVRYV